MYPHSKNRTKKIKKKLLLPLHRACVFYRKIIFSIRHLSPEIVEFKADIVALGKTPVYLKWECRNTTYVEVEGVQLFLKNAGHAIVYPVQAISSYTLIAHGAKESKKSVVTVRHIEVHSTDSIQKAFPATIISQRFNSRDFSRRMIYPGVEHKYPEMRTNRNRILTPQLFIKQAQLKINTEEYQPIAFES